MTTPFSVRISVRAQGARLEHASVAVTGPETQARQFQTDPKGTLTFADLVPGEYEIVVEAPGFARQSRMVKVPTRTDTEIFLLATEGQMTMLRGGIEVPIVERRNVIAVKLSEGSDDDDSDASLAADRARLEGVASRLNLRMMEEPAAVLRSRVAMLSLGRRMSATGFAEKIAEVGAEAEVESAGAIVMETEETVTFLTADFAVKFIDSVDETGAQALADEFGLKLGKRMGAIGNVWRMHDEGPADYALIDKARQMHARDDVIYAELLVDGSVVEDAVTPTDYLFPQQWDHRIIDTPNAWEALQNIDPNKTFGSSEVVIAVVDSGVNTAHPEFSGTVTGGASKILRSFDFVNMVANNNSLSSDHGTCCASAAAASTNNASAVAGANEGVAGVAGNTRVIGIRRGGTEQTYADMYLWAGGLDPESEIANFPAVATPGADVITNSFGFSTGLPISALMQDVFDTLTDDGRGGKGCLLFFSAGNAASDLDTTFARPWGMYARCFSVSASTLGNDGVTEQLANYSSFGSVVEFCAPSHDAYVANLPLHNPNANFAPFTATRAGNPDGNDAAVGRPTVTTTLAAAVAAGDTVISLASSAGIAVGDAIRLGAANAQGARSYRVTASNAGANTVTIHRGSLNAQANGAAVAASAADYRSNFGGTSHATPLSAGVGALVLSMNPELTWNEVRDIMRETAVKIDPNNTNAIGRWRDDDGRISTDPAYEGPLFSEFYGFGRIDAFEAVKRAGWRINLVTPALTFVDVFANETSARAVRFDVLSAFAADFLITASPGAPFSTPFGNQSIPAGGDTNMVQEVYVWVLFEAGAAGTTANASITITVPQTGQVFTVPITANVIERPTSAIMLSLDQSGSMLSASGVGTANRIDVLRYSADILVDVLDEGDAAGIVSFDQDPHDVLVPPVGPLSAAGGVFDPLRDQLRSAITSFNPNPSGATAIGDGLERAQQRLNPVTGYGNKAVIVMTDGMETASKYITDVAGSITDQVFAVGLGKAQNINPAALEAITAGNQGYTLLTGDLNIDSRYKLAKYFLQILAGVKNDEVVVDPSGWLTGGAVVKVPIAVNEADSRLDVILAAEIPQAVRFEIEAPDGTRIDPGSVSSIGGTHQVGRQSRLYRLPLPLASGAGIREGTWHALLSLDEKLLLREIGQLVEKQVITREEAVRMRSNGLQYLLLAHARSTLRMQADIDQKSYLPGADLSLSARLDQHGIPLERGVRVDAVVTDPAGGEKTVTLSHRGGGFMGASVSTSAPGTYTVRFRASGRSFRGQSFTRELVRTGNVWRGGDAPLPTTPPGSGTTSEGDMEKLCAMLLCLTGEKVLTDRAEKYLEEKGINIRAARECIEKHCDKRETPPRPIFPTLDPASISRLRETAKALNDMSDQLAGTPSGKT